MTQIATKQTILPTATIGPQSWRNDTFNNIKQSESIVNKSDKSNEQGKSVDPLPHLRETVAELSNDVAHKHFREVRAVVFVLRESLLETNEEIKALTNGKEALEKALDHIRKDIKLNQESVDIRKARPTREKAHDGVDDMLNAEKLHLMNLKKSLEAQLLLVQQQLQVLDKNRKRLAAVLQERGHVLDLICHALPSLGNGSGFYTAHSPRASTGHIGQCGAVVRSGSPMRQSVSANGRLTGLTVDPLGALTPEAKAALQDARDARNRAAILRSGLKNNIANAAKTQQAAHKSVNNGLNQKIAETNQLKQNLHMASGSNRHALHRAQRWYDATDKAWGLTLGPISTSDLSDSERLTRPIVKVFQGHPGTNLPEAQHIVRSGDGLLESLQGTSQNIGLLKLARLKLKDDIRDKSAAIATDGSVVRLRRRKASHRWNMREAF